MLYSIMLNLMKSTFNYLFIYHRFKHGNISEKWWKYLRCGDDATLECRLLIQHIVVEDIFYIYIYIYGDS